jgi:hypothetical protein
LAEGNAANEKRVVEKVKLLLKNYLELDNVSFLFGSGSSIHLGAVAIRNFPFEIESHVKEKDNLSIGEESPYKGIYNELINTVKSLQFTEFTRITALDKQTTSDLEKETLESFKKWYKIEDGLIRALQSNDLAIEFERVLNFLIAKNYVLEEGKKAKRTDKISELLIACKEGLFNAVDVEKRQVPPTLLKRKKESKYPHNQEHAKLLETESKYIFHQKFIKALLQRPLNLRRANIFTANYDLAFEYSFDKLGVHYIDGFAGFHKRCFKPETFEYDMFYPGSTTSGKVQRIEKVLRYFKLHGSISWVNSDKRDANNLYGIEELPLSLVEKLKKKGEILIYPTAVKKTYTLDLPYSELFRQFAATISQPQSVLITVGYAFADEHFNDIIFQALSNPSFTLIVVDFYGTENNPNIERIKNLDDSRIIILQGVYFGDFLTFANTLMPDFYDVGSNVKIARTLNEYFSSTSDKEHKI